MAQLVYDKTGRLLFTKEMAQEYTILAPQMLPDHFAMLENILQEAGYQSQNAQHHRSYHSGGGAEIRP